MIGFDINNSFNRWFTTLYVHIKVLECFRVNFLLASRSETSPNHHQEEVSWFDPKSCNGYLQFKLAIAELGGSTINVKKHPQTLPLTPNPEI